MEILVAVFILGIVVTTVMASFSMVFSTTAAMEEDGAAFEMGKNCLNRITTDLENIVIAERPFYQPPKTDGPLDPYRLQGTEESIGGTRFAKLRLASRAHVPLGGSPREGIAEIVYYVQARPDGSLQLKRADHLYPYPRFEERSSDPVLCENVKSLAFSLSCRRRDRLRNVGFRVGQICQHDTGDGGRTAGDCGRRRCLLVPDDGQAPARPQKTGLTRCLKACSAR